MMDFKYDKLMEILESYPFPLSTKISIKEAEDMYSYYKSMAYNGNMSIVDILLAMLITGVCLFLIYAWHYYLYNKKPLIIFNKFQLTSKYMISMYTLVAIIYILNFTNGLLIANTTLVTVIAIIYIVFEGLLTKERKVFKHITPTTTTYVLILLVICTGIYIDDSTTKFIETYEKERNIFVEDLETEDKVQAELLLVDIDKTLTDWSYVGSVALGNGEIIKGLIEVAYTDKWDYGVVEYERSYEYSDLKLTREPIILILPKGERLYEYMVKREGEGLEDESAR